MYFIYCLDHHFPISILYICICIYACMQYVYEAVLFVPTTLYMQYVLHCTGSGQRAQATASHAQAAASQPRPRPAMPRRLRQPASPGHGQPCPGGSQPAQATTSQAMARRLAIQPRQRPAAHLYTCFKGLRAK
jgi:hypothetical protein